MSPCLKDIPNFSLNERYVSMLKNRNFQLWLQTLGVANGFTLKYEYSHFLQNSYKMTSRWRYRHVVSSLRTPESIGHSLENTNKYVGVHVPSRRIRGVRITMPCSKSTDFSSAQSVHSPYVDGSVINTSFSQPYTASSLYRLRVLPVPILKLCRSNTYLHHYTLIRSVFLYIRNKLRGARSCMSTDVPHYKGFTATLCTFQTYFLTVELVPAT